jgi:hypothetical protein
MQVRRCAFVNASVWHFERIKTFTFIETRRKFRVLCLSYQSMFERVRNLQNKTKRQRADRKF